MQEENRGCEEGARGGCNNFGMPFNGNGCGCGDNGILFFIIIFLLLFTNSGCCGRG